MFQFDNGGKFECQGAGLMAADMTLLKIGRIDRNTCTYSISNIVIDNNAKGFKLLVTDPRNVSPAVVTLSGHISELGYKTPIIEANGPVMVTLRDFYNLEAGAIQCRSNVTFWSKEKRRQTMAPFVRIDGARLWNITKGNILLAKSSRGVYALKWRDCTDWFGQVLEDGAINTAKN